MKQRQFRKPEAVQQSTLNAELLASVERHLHNDPETALSYARRACEIARDNSDRAAEADAWIAQGECYTVMSNYDAAIECGDRAEDVYKALANEDGQCRACYVRSVAYERLGRSQEALHSMNFCLEYWHNKPGAEEWYFRVLNSLGIFYKSAENYSRALEYYSKALHLLGEEQSARTAKLLLNIGNIYVHSGDTEKGLELYTHAQSMGSAIGDEYVVTHALINKANAHLVMFDKDKALVYYERALTHAEKYGARTKLAILTGMSEVYSAAQDFEQALSVLREAQHIAVQGNLQRNVMSIRASIGKTLVHLQHYERAIAELMQTIPIAEELNSPYYLRQMYRYLSMAYEELGDIAQAHLWYKRYSDVHEKIMHINKQKALAEMQARFEVERAAQENEIYRLRTQQLEQELAMRSNELAGVILRLVDKNELLRTMRHEIVRSRTTDRDEHLLSKFLSWIDSNLDAESTWAVFEQQFNQIHHNFTRKLVELCPRLTTTEVRICSLLKIQLASKDIASLLALSPRTVETHRYNIRKKLQLDTPEHLAVFLSSL